MTPTVAGLEVALDAGEVVFGREGDAALRDLDRMADAIGYHQDERELINAPEMELVHRQAARALALVEASDGSECTVEIVE